MTILVQRTPPIPSQSAAPEPARLDKPENPSQSTKRTQMIGQNHRASSTSRLCPTPPFRARGGSASYATFRDLAGIICQSSTPPAHQGQPCRHGSTEGTFMRIPSECHTGPSASAQLGALARAVPALRTSSLPVIRVSGTKCACNWACNVATTWVECKGLPQSKAFCP